MKTYLERNLEQIRTDLGLDAISLFSRDESQRKLFLESWAGDKPRESCPFGVTPLGECGEKGEPLSFQKRHVRVKYQSECLIPLFSAGAHVGVLQCVSVQADFFESDFLSRLKAVVNLIENNWES